ncbi:hypothetical protein [Magnetococcus sp. PR-3]|uniref:hypothetical protein n=1 Tax=Magnetococcus sp. PR-3 TaxID=3120355 RepID=UPI002FCE071E
MPGSKRHKAEHTLLLEISDLLATANNKIKEDPDLPRKSLKRSLQPAEKKLQEVLQKYWKRAQFIEIPCPSCERRFTPLPTSVDLDGTEEERKAVTYGGLEHCSERCMKRTRYKMSVLPALQKRREKASEKCDGLAGAMKRWSGKGGK